MKESSNQNDLNIKKELKKVEKQSSDLLKSTQKLKKNVKDNYFNNIDEFSNLEEQVDFLDKIDNNIKKAYLNIFDINDEMKARWRDLKKSQKKNKIVHAPANGIIDKVEEQSNHFAKGLNIYKLLIICFVGSFVGVIIEMLWCLIRNGYIESRAGLVYGPFNLLYGAGAVLLTLCLYKFRNRGSWISFLGGFIVGSLLEYVCSWGQELLLGTRSWDYSEMAFNLNGRICLLYSIFWGVLGVLWIKNIYPRMAKLILKIPNKIGKALTYFCTIFLAFNIIITCITTVRWTQRIDGIPATNSFIKFIDERFPNERMEDIFANMEFTKEKESG